MRGRIGERFDCDAFNADAIEQGMHGELRVHGTRRVFLALVTRDLAPGFFVEVDIQSRQHDRAVR